MSPEGRTSFSEEKEAKRLFFNFDVWTVEDERLT
jgi:hypothetical protein